MDNNLSLNKVNEEYIQLGIEMLRKESFENKEKLLNDYKEYYKACALKGISSDFETLGEYKDYIGEILKRQIEAQSEYIIQEIKRRLFNG